MSLVKKEELGQLAFQNMAQPSQVGLGNVANVAAIPLSNLDTDGTLAGDSDSKVPSQKAVKTYVDGKQSGMTPLQSAYWNF